MAIITEMLLSDGISILKCWVAIKKGVSNNRENVRDIICKK